MLSQEERTDWLRLIRTDSIGPITFYRLLAKYGSAAAAIERLPRHATAAGRASPIKIYDRNLANEEIDAVDSAGARLIAACEPDYPAMLRPVPDCPPLLCVRGHTSLFERPAVAVIGARNASAVGRKIARSLSSDLGEAGVVVVSGLARGIDGAAHMAALDSGTIAVVAGGIDVVYPPEHETLMRDIGDRGAVISERAIGSQPTARDFPRRNRLISGLSRAVVVVEAAARSGTLITARFALEQGRDVFAVPGSPLDPRCQGANRLISDGATLVQTAEDILQVLAEQNRGAQEPSSKDLFDWSAQHDINDVLPDSASEDVRNAVREALSFTPLHRDEIYRELNLPAGIVADALLDLVLAGEAEEHSGGRFSLAAAGA
jgi:DNA processing protein